MTIDRNRASALGISAGQIELALQTAYGSREVSTIYAPTNDYTVFVEVRKDFQRNPDALTRLYVRSSSGELVPLSTVARMSPGVGPIAVNHDGQFPAVTISYNLRPGVALSEGVAAVERVSLPLLPDSVSAKSQGTAQAFQDSLKGMGWLLLLGHRGHLSGAGHPLRELHPPADHPFPACRRRASGPCSPSGYSASRWTSTASWASSCCWAS